MLVNKVGNVKVGQRVRENNEICTTDLELLGHTCIVCTNTLQARIQAPLLTIPGTKWCKKGMMAIALWDG